MNKRVPDQYHLTLHNQSTYKGFPLVNCRSGFIGEYLERLHCAINQSVQSCSRVFAVRVDLHFPQYYFPCGQEVLSNEHLRSFIKTLRRRLKHYKNEKKRDGRRVRPVDFKYVWAREYGPCSDKPHFHLLLLFNGHAFNSLGHFSGGYESLYNRIGESWGEAVGVHFTEGNKFAHFPDIGQYLINSRDLEQVARVFCRASYLAKVESKNFHDGYHVFGGSRI